MTSKEKKHWKINSIVTVLLLQNLSNKLSSDLAPDMKRAWQHSWTKLILITARQDGNTLYFVHFLFKSGGFSERHFVQAAEKYSHNVQLLIPPNFKMHFYGFPISPQNRNKTIA